MTSENPAAGRYLQRLERELAALAGRERADILREIEDHLADAQAAGRPLAEVLAALGPADALARAYAVELALNRPPGRLTRCSSTCDSSSTSRSGRFGVFVPARSRNRARRGESGEMGRRAPRKGRAPYFERGEASRSPSMVTPTSSAGRPSRTTNSSLKSSSPSTPKSVSVMGTRRYFAAVRW